MRIGVDARPLQNDNQFRGIGKYTHSILLAMADVLDEQQGEAHTFVFYLEQNEPVPDLLASRYPGARHIRVPKQRIADMRYVRLVARLHSLVPADRADIDVLLQTDPWGGIPAAVPTVAVFHDAIPLLFKGEPEKLPFGRSWILSRLHRTAHTLRYRRSLAWYRRAAVTVTISQSSRRDYLRLIDPRPRHSVRVILEAPVPADTPTNKPGSPGDGDRQSATVQFEQLGLRDRPYLLYVGGIDLRKNIMQLLYDLKELLPEHPDLKLVLVGREFELSDPLRLLGWQTYLQDNPEVAQAVVMPGYVPSRLLSQLYAHARAFVFPSRYEGFGLPILEAMAQDCPVICYRNSSIPEVAGDAALIVDDGAPMAPAIAGLLGDPRLREDLIAAGRAQLAHFSWHTAAREMLTALKDAAAGRGGVVRTT